MNTARRIEEMIDCPDDLYWAIEQECPGMIPESLGVDFSGYPFGDGSGLVATEDDRGETAFEALDDYRKGLYQAIETLRGTLEMVKGESSDGNSLGERRAAADFQIA